MHSQVFTPVGKRLNFKAPGCINISVCYSDPVTDNIAQPKCANWPLWLSDNFIFSSNLSQFGFELQTWHKSCSLTLVAGRVSLLKWSALLYIYFFSCWLICCTCCCLRRTCLVFLQLCSSVTIQIWTRKIQFFRKKIAWVNIFLYVKYVNRLTLPAESRNPFSNRRKSRPTNAGFF